MKNNIYIASGEYAAYDNLTCKNLTVRGNLCIKGTLTADAISGNGVILAETIRAKTVCGNVLDAKMIVADIVMARQIYATELRAKESVVASSYLDAALVKAPKVVVADAEIKDVQTDELIKVSAKPHSIFGALILSVLRSAWLSLVGDTVVTVQRESVPEVVAECVDYNGDIESELSPEVSSDAAPDIIADAVEYSFSEAAAQPATMETQDAMELLNDPEIRRLVAMKKMAKRYGGTWTLKRQPGAIDISADDFEDGTNGAAA